MMLDFPNSELIVHFTGIGGIGMSGIAELLNDLGCPVQGSDIARNANIERLEKKGIKIIIGHEGDNIANAGVVVVSSAIGDDNVEISRARQNNIPVIQRAEMLAELMRLKKSVAVAGTHGKTTTTSMIAALFEAAKLDPTVVNGGIINCYGSNTRMGYGKWLIAEADESDGSFMKLPAGIAVITNIDPEHLEHYGNYDNLKQTFLRFIQNIPFYGFAVLCADHEEVLRLLPHLSDRRILTYGYNNQAMVRATNLRIGDGGTHFDVEAQIKAGIDIHLKDLFLAMYGEHNVQNALAAITIGLDLEFSESVIRNALADFQGVKRRFTHIGNVGKIKIIDDYAHHPVEIRAVLKTCRSVCKGQVIAIAQPHRYSRLESLFAEFQTAFHDADKVLISDVYAAGELEIDGINNETLAQAIREAGHHSVQAFADNQNLDKILAEMIQDNQGSEIEMIVFLGAGSSTIWAQEMPEKLEKRLEKRLFER